MKLFFQRPYLFFLGVAIITLLVAINYFYYYPESYFDLGGDYELSLSCSVCWGVFSGYCFILSAIYYTAAKGKLKTKGWLVLSHFIFVLLFLVLFFVFSSFNTSYVQDHISGLPFFTLITIYAIIFFLDVGLFVTGLVLLVASVLSFKKPDRT